MVGDVAGKSLLHLQCHFGIDTLSWARLGARVTGADFSPAADRAGHVDSRPTSASPTPASSARTCTTCPRTSTATFDVVYTSRGVLGWLPDIRGWAEVVAHFLAPGGTFFITEAHPVFNAFDDEGVAPGELRLAYPYFEHAEPLVFPVKGSYADPDADVGDQAEHGWDHGLGEIVTALIEAGLRIESLVEHPFVAWAADFLVEATGRRAGACRRRRAGSCPLMFSLTATKPVG